MAANDGGTDTKDDNSEKTSRTSTTAAAQMDGSIEVDDDIPVDSNSEVDSSTDVDDSSSEQSIQDDISNENVQTVNADVGNSQSTKTDTDGDTIIQSTATEAEVSSNNKESEVILLDMDGTIIDDTDEESNSNDIQQVIENEEQTLNVDGSTANVDDTVQSTSGDNAKKDSAEEIADNTSTDESVNNNKEKEKKLIILPSFGDDPIIDYPPPQEVATKSNDELEVEKAAQSVDEQVSSDSTSDEDELPSADSTKSSDDSQLIESNATDKDETDANSTKEGDESSTTDSEDNSTAASSTEDQIDEDDGPRQIKQVDYASKAAGAIILENSPSLEGASNLLTSDKDKYSIAPCADKKYVVISLSEDILVKQIKLSNYERYSSRVKEFQVLSSQEYPSTGGNSNDNSEENAAEKDVWNTIGTYTVHSKSGEQTFELEEPSWARYLKFRFISHWGSEHYCTLSQIKVHGSTMLQGFHEQWIESENKINEEQELKEEEVVVDKSVEIDQQQEEEVVDEEDGDLDTAAGDQHVEVGETDDRSDGVEQLGELSPETMGTDEQIGTESEEAEQLESSVDEDTADTEEVVESPTMDKSEVPQNIENDYELDIATDSRGNDEGGKKIDDASDEIKSSHTPLEGSVTPDEKESVDKQASGGASSDGEEQEQLNQEEELSADGTSSSSSHNDPPDTVNEDDQPKSSQIKEEGNQHEAIDDGKDHVEDDSSIVAAVIDESVTKESKDVTAEDEKSSDSDQELDQAIQPQASKITASQDATTNTNISQSDASGTSQSKGELSTDSVKSKGEDSTVKGSVSKTDTKSKETSKPEKKNIQKEKPKTTTTKGGDLLKRETIAHPSKDLDASASELYAKLIRRFPHAKCIKDLDLQAFKSKSLLANAERSGGSSVGGGAPKMEPIFAKITNEIKSVQLQQTQYEQYISALKTCYESVFLDVAKDLDSTKGTDVEQRLASLERAVFLSEMTSKGGRSSYSTSHDRLSSLFPTLSSFTVSPFQFSVPIYTMPTLEEHSTVIIGSLTTFLLAVWLLLRRERKEGSANNNLSQHNVAPLKKNTINGMSTNSPNKKLESELAETKNKLIDSDKKFRGLKSQHTSLQEEHEALKQRYSQLEQTVRSMENEAELMTPRRNNINVIPNENEHSSVVNAPTLSSPLPSSPPNKEE